MLCLNLYLHQTFPTDLIFQTLWKSPCYNLFFHSIPRLDGEVCNSVISRCTQPIEASYQVKEPFNDPIKLHLVRSAARIDIRGADMFCLSKLLLPAFGKFLQSSWIMHFLSVCPLRTDRWTSTFILLYSSVNTQLQKKLFWLCVTCNWSNIFDITFHSTLHYIVQNDFYAAS